MADKFIFKWKPMISPFRITYQFWIWQIPSYLKEPPCTLRTPSTCRCSRWKQCNTVWRKTDMHVWLGIILEVFKGGRQIYIQMKAYDLPFQNNIQFWIWQMHSYLKEPPCALRTPFNLPVFSVKTVQYSVKKNRYACMVGYNFRSFQRWPTNLYSNESLGSPLSE